MWPESAPNDLSHGSYGDYSGVVFHGPPTKGFSFDRLAISDNYMRPLFAAIIEQLSRYDHKTPTPKLVLEWHSLSGWMERDEKTAVPLSDIEDLIVVLSRIEVQDLSTHCDDTEPTPEQCLRCAAVICDFLTKQLARGSNLFIERD